MTSRVAEACFAENRRLFANPHGSAEQQEKFNLYNGLANLADAVAMLERQVAELRQMVGR